MRDEETIDGIWPGSSKPCLRIEVLLEGTALVTPQPKGFEVISEKAESGGIPGFFTDY